MKKIHLTENELVELIQKVIKEKYTDSETKEETEVGEEKKKKDRCHRCADQSYGPETSAYKSGAMVKCRQGKIWKGKKC